MAEWFFVWKRSVRYKTQSKFLRDVCVNFRGYIRGGQGYDWGSEMLGKLLPRFKLTKEERDKYKVLLRLMK